MKRFRFRLDRILAIREYNERQIEIEMANATRVCLDLSSRIDLLAEERAATVLGSSDEAASADRSPSERSELDIASLQARDRYLGLIDHRTTELSEILAEREMEREQVREKLAEASRARKVFEKLKERKNQEYDRASQRHAGSVLDEIAGNAVIRRHIEGDD